MIAVSFIRHLRRPRLVVAAVIGAAVVTGGGVAYAYWPASGTGSGSGTTASMATVTVDALAGSDAPGSTLYPGGTADVVLRASNPNSFAVQVMSVTQTAGHSITADSGHAGCTTTGVTFSAPSAPNITIPAHASGQLIDLPGAAAMDTSSSSGCQGATFHIPVTLTVQR